MHCDLQQANGNNIAGEKEYTAGKHYEIRVPDWVVVVVNGVV